MQSRQIQTNVIFSQALILDMNTKISVSNFDIENKHLQKLLGVTIDHRLNFHNHVSNLCKKASAKISLTGRVV